MQPTLKKRSSRTKRCSRCGVTKGCRQFGRLTMAPDGRRGRCRICVRAETNARRRGQPLPDLRGNRRGETVAELECRVLAAIAQLTEDHPMRALARGMASNG